MFLVLLGPDGCGKTTIAEHLLANCEGLGCSSGEIYSFNFRIMPRFSSIKSLLYACLGRKYHNKYAHTEGELHAGMRLQPLSAWKASLLFLWYLPDYLLGYFSLWRAKRDKRLIVFTRYYYDYYYQRIYSRLPRLLLNVCRFLVPKPDKIVLLDREPEAIYAGKPELTVAEIERQNAEIIRCCGRLSGFAIVDANHGIEATWRRVMGACIKLSEKC